MVILSSIGTAIGGWFASKASTVAMAGVVVVMAMSAFGWVRYDAARDAVQKLEADIEIQKLQNTINVMEEQAKARAQILEAANKRAEMAEADADEWRKVTDGFKIEINEGTAKSCADDPAYVGRMQRIKVGGRR